MSLRVVLYGEGGRDVGGEGPVPSPGVRLTDWDLGPAHILLRRSLHRIRRVPEQAVHFEAGLRVDRGRVPRGGMLLDRENLRRLCSWATPARAPQLVVVLVDADDDAARKATLEGYLAGLSVPSAVGVAVQEFESWLVADGPAASHVCGATVAVDEEIERLERRDAKERLNGWISSQSRLGDREIRRSIAETCDLTVLERRCPSFRALLLALTPRS